MKQGRFIKLIMALTVVVLVLASCQSPAPTADLQSQALTAAIQTMTAMPSVTPFTPATDTPEASTPTPTLTPTIAVTATPMPVGPSAFPADVNPLTGLVVGDPSILDRRPVMIKVSNFPRSGRPHAGLSAADIVFEYFIGEGTNRFMAVYYGNDSEQVGPIRSGRMVDAQIVPMYGGILGYSGAYFLVDEKIRTALGNRAVISSPSSCPAICAGGTVISVFSNTAEMTKYAENNAIDNTRPNLDGMKFDPIAPQGGQAGQTLNIQYNIYNQGEWRYDPTSGKYLRWIEDVDANNNLNLIELTDRNNNQQLAFSNVIVLFANYTQYAPTMHDISITANTGGMRAVIFRDGLAYEAIWKSAGAGQPIQFFTTDGQPFPLKNGNTWMNITSAYSNFDQPEAGKWALSFFL